MLKAQLQTKETGHPTLFTLPPLHDVRWLESEEERRKGEKGLAAKRERKRKEQKPGRGAEGK